LSTAHFPRLLASRPVIAAALTVAVLAVAIPVFAQAVAPRPTAIPVPPTVRPGPGVPPPPADPDNTGRPEDPATPLSRQPGDLMSANTAVYVDDSFASVDKLRKALDYARKGQAQLAISQFQEIVSNYGQKLVLLNDNSYVSITDYVRERLLQMPAVKTGMYDQLFGTEARREIEAATENRDVATLIRMCDRYYPSTTALKGLDQAAQWYFERGEFAAAAVTWRKLLAHPMAGDRVPEYLFRASLAQHLAKNDAAATAFRDRLQQDFPEAKGTVAGKTVTLLAQLDELLAQVAWEKVNIAGDEWPAFGGGPGRNALLTTQATIGAKLWSLPVSEGAAAVSSGLDAQRELLARQVVQQQALLLRSSGISSSYDTSTLLSSHPVLSNGMLFIHQGNRILAVSANAGTRLWSYPPPNASGEPAGGISVRLGAHDSVAVYGDRVFAVMPTGASGSAIVNGRVILSSSVISAYAPTQVVCLGRDDGRLIWSHAASEVKLEKEGAVTYIGEPLVTRQGIFLMARKAGDQSFSQLYLVRLDRETGEPTWSCYLCSTSTYNNYSSNVALANVPIPTLVDDVLYVSTGQGADCAIDANAGRILWLYVTSTKADQLATAARLVPSWQYNPPVVVGDKLVTIDATQAMRIYDRWNGRWLKTIKAAELPDNPGSYMDVLAGAVGSKVIFSVKNTSYCFEIAELLRDRKANDYNDKPRPEWKSLVDSKIAGTATGRPFLTATAYYVPFTKCLEYISLKTGKADMSPWDSSENMAREPDRKYAGNLLVTSEQVIVVNDQEVAGYSKWETARDNRLAFIKAHPRDPAGYLDLAEVSYRTDHQDLAQENMKRAVDLASAGEAPAGQSAADILGRLYRTNLDFAEQLLDKKETEQRDLSRFYFQQCQAAARTPEQQAEWRLRLSDLSVQQHKPDEAVTLFSEILTDPALRVAGFRDPEGAGIQSAGATAERRIGRVVVDHGPVVYQRFEDQAAALTQRAVAAKDAAGLQQIVDSYPNAGAAITAATALAGLYQDKQDWDNARRTLWWLEPRVSGDAQARAIADLATVNLALKKFPSASAWASRGQRLNKDFTWTQAGAKMTFAELKAQIAKAGGGVIDGRLPTLPAAKGSSKVALDPNPMGVIFARASQLLVPLETAASLRPPHMMFIRTGDKLRIYDTGSATDLATNIPLPHDAPAVLVGATRDIAVLMQYDAAIFIDLKSKVPAVVHLNPVPGAQSPAVSGTVIRRVDLGGRQVTVIEGNLVIDGQSVIGAADAITLIDANTGQVIIPNAGGSDPDALRRAAFNVLGSGAAGARFTTARIISNNLLILAGGQLMAYNIETGKPVFPAMPLPPGSANAVVGNDDMTVVQIDAADGRSCTFGAFDAQTGRPLKQLKLDNERAAWRGLGEDGTLFLVTDTASNLGASGSGAVKAYDMVSPQNGTLWERTGLGSRFAGASALTLDGLVVVSNTNDVLCLALESGETRWQSPLKVDLTSTTSSSSALRSVVEGDHITFQSSAGSADFFTWPVTDRQKNQYAWYGVTLTSPPPQPRQSLQLCDSWVVECLAGSPAAGGVRGTEFLVSDRKGGNLRLRLPLGTASDSPFVRSWQVLDNGIAFEVGNPGVAAGGVPGTLYFWRAVP
jgi:outer membrane protein assembly factor BamB